MNGEKQKVINVFTVSDTNPFKFTVYSETIAEDIVVLCCQSLNIGPVARHLFALRFHNRKEFVSPGVRLLESDKNDFEFRLRFKVPSFHKMLTFKRLEHIDPRAHYYYFNQVRVDIMDNKIPDISYDKNRDDLVGLGVVDMYRVMLEQGVSRETVENDYKKYIPKEVRKHHYFFVKKPVHDSLTSIIGSNIRNVKDVVNAYLQKFEDMAPNYLTEECEAIMDDAGTVRAVIMRVDPYHKEFPGVAFCYEGKSEWNHLCSIEDLCYISVSDDRTTEISRKTGIPVYLRFSSILVMASFISLLDGYYRLSVKWTFNLCKNLPTPSLQRLYAMKCHGPVGGEFSYAKLEEKRNNQPGCYILRESETAYDVFYLDVCTNQSPKPSTFKITKKSDKCFEFSEDNKSYESIKQLVIALSAPDSPVQLLDCLPPSEYDQSPLLLCKTDDSGLNGINSFINGMMPVVMGTPMCIDTRNLQVYKARKRDNNNDMLLTYRGVWRYQKNKKIDVAINVLRTKERETHLPDLLELAGKWAFLDSAAVVKLYGITLMSPVSIVTEYFPLGSLDVYLHEHKNSIEGVDLVEAATYLATAVWHLEEAGIVHGNIRLSKLQVASHTDNSFSVRLSDPGLRSSYTSNDIHWIPIEWQSFEVIEGARRSIAADMWAVGTTLWELFSYGESPDTQVYKDPIKFYGDGGRLPKPKACSSDVYDLMSSCWNADPYRRKKPQEAMRDINQILYQVFNSRRAHAYSTVVNNDVNKIKSKINKFGSASTIGDLSSIISIDQDDYGKNFNWMGTGGGLVDSSTSLLHQDSSSQSDLMSQSMSVSIPNFDLHTATTSLDSVTSLQGIIELDEYNIILKGKIGQGFYGEVYKGSMEQLVPIDGDAEPQLVAVKKLKSDSITRNSFEDFHREITIMEKLKHPNIVEVKGVILEPEISLVMEYVQHGSLLCYLKIHKEKLDPYTNLLKFAYDVALGMEYLGQANIVHRDLAARNILVASETHVKISDFGLAQVMNSNDYYFSRTNRELPVKWYAPESLENLKFSARSDVWSYGVTLFEMFSYGEDPCLAELKNCQGIDTIKLLTALKNGARLPCPSTCPVEIYATLISQCWKYDSHLRLSFSEALNQIKRILNNNCHYMHVST